ncbi:hypothetical protein HS125_03735 [bacterium]|nr:hypothetical protein [bacterium]
MFETDIDRVREGVAVFNTLHHKKKQRPFPMEEEPPRPEEKPAAHPFTRPPEPGHRFDQVV